MKRQFNLKKLMKAADHSFLYTWKNDNLALMAKNGYVGMITNDKTAFSELEEAGCTLEQSSIYDTLDRMVFAKEMKNPMYRSGITVLAPEKKTVVAYVGDDVVKLIDTKLDEIFEPRITTTSISYNSAMVYVCDDCYGLICPVYPKQTSWLKDMSQILQYFRKE